MNSKESSAFFKLFFFGSIIYRGNVELIAGYDPDKVTDREGLAKWVGSHLIYMGFSLLLFAVFSFFFNHSIGNIFIFVTVVLISRTFLGCKKFEKKID